MINSIQLEQGWKVELAKQVKTSIIRDKNQLIKHTNFLDIWQKLFINIQVEN